MHFSIDRSPHWQEGGTGITNFPDKEVHIYAVAIAMHGDPHLFIGPAMPGQDGSYHPEMGQYALRDNHPNYYRSLSNFWKVYDFVKAVDGLTRYKL